MWTCRESNPGPNKKQINFLHAYSFFGFSARKGERHPKSCLIFLNFVIEPKILKNYLYFACVPLSLTIENGSWRNVLLHILDMD